MSTKLLKKLPANMLLLLFMIPVLFAVAAATLNLLAQTFHTQERIRTAILLNDELLRLQLDEETGIRGYAATGMKTFLQPYVVASTVLDATVGQLSMLVANLELPGGTAPILSMQRLHDQWLFTTAQPMLRHTATVRSQLHGKSLIDMFRRSNEEMRDLIEDRARRADADTEVAFTEVIVFGTLIALGIGFVIILGTQRHVELHSALEREHAVVETLQRAFINRRAALPKMVIGSAYLSATAEAAIGGDLFDVKRLDDHRGYFLIADVSGKGLAAAVDTALIKYSINAIAQHISDPAEILHAFNNIFLQSKSRDESFVVLFLGIFNTQTLSLRYASAGHSQAYLRRGPNVEGLRVTGPVIGLIDVPVYDSHEISLYKNDTLVLATDGLTEARTPAKEMLGDDGAIAWIREAPDHAPQALVDELVERLHAYVGGRTTDDLALLAMRVVGETTASGSESREIRLAESQESREAL